ncbi:hypothetical protein C8N43_2867 [Litoreibacter ponti]|uniref:5-carboxymethyl-2-hydroxymuconate isomerase n=1 Tax=Litoreibacter ponti TaxID=1510457 RepID=A0A2T6BDE7_9RHOB|nr:hypothetical protein [Litoreibacter ponti]PTX54062.1 hypothetical protein C8N43_2867 [Litoreibacter ponti]
MPQADLLYSADLTIDAPDILSAVEQVIAARDSGAGACKGRAYPSREFHHSHVTLRVAMLDKPHRDDAFMGDLLRAIEAEVKSHVSQPCALAVELSFSSSHYSTGMHEGAAP